MTIEETEKRLSLQIDEIRAVPMKSMIAQPTLEETGIDKNRMGIIKEAVYGHILQYLNIEGYPTEESSDYKEANISDLVLYTIGPIIDAVRNIRRNIRLKREKEIISSDGLTGGMEEFLVVDRVAIAEHKSVLIIEAKRSSMGQAMTQILLAMKDARDNNAGGVIYGFVTIGEDWRMLSYDGSEFVKTNKFTVLFDTMRDQKEKWMSENSVIVDCMVFALTTGGIAMKDVVV
ncbi:hypothetical protein L873DRAFT_1687562 [Choiromyces venosus 120613-1]|uniref:Uncharacterized protein n=1 Tax=Choiromyces venosus 120613-1 TaxID=1336337 RepID=A0A3N4JXD6_9PEZI|nr:hypothetical protein L873DRAFT_1687562 [Choiromyces venosus 120613-1]